MTLVVTEPVSDRSLTTVAAVRAELPASKTSSSDEDLISEMILRATDIIQRYTNRYFGYQRYTESQASEGEAKKVLTAIPLASVEGVTYQGEDRSDDVQIYDYDAGIVYNKNARFDASMIYKGPIVYDPFAAGEQLWEFDYYAGYWLPNQEGSKPSDVKNLPADVKGAATDLVKYLWRSRADPRDVASMQVGNGQVEFRQVNVNTGMPKNIQAQLAQWRVRF